LNDLGLTPMDSRVYVFLAKKGTQKAIDISKPLKMNKQQLYRSLTNLQSKGIVTSTLEHPSRFTAISFDKVLDLFVKTKMEEAQQIKQSKDELLSVWQSIQVEESDRSAKFMVLEGRNVIYSKIQQMVQETKNQLSIISTVQGLARANQHGLFDATLDHGLKSKIQFRLLTELSGQNIAAVKRLFERKTTGAGSFEGRTPDLGLKPFTNMVIKDDEEAVFFIKSGNQETDIEQDNICLWTNCKALVQSFNGVFEDLWHNSTEIAKRIVEIETGKPTAKTYILSDLKASKKKFDTIMETAEEEIMIVTSTAGLVDTSKNIAQLKRRVEKGVSVKIMAPIIRENLEAAMQLSGCCTVRHVPGSYVETTIVDGKHLFQFKDRTSECENQNESMSFENTVYTNESDYVEKTRNMLNDIWKHATAPSAVTVEEIAKPPTPSGAPVPEDEYTVSRKDSAYQKMTIGVEEKPKAITEEYVLNKIINAKRDPNVKRFYGSSATAVIHPPSIFNLPDMLLTFYHCNKPSYWGAEDYMIVYLWLETPNGLHYVPVALVGDNLEGIESRKLGYRGTPAYQNYHILKKDELKIQVYGNTLFAGWTVPITLFPPQYVLPPASLLFEGYGKIKTAAITFTMPSGSKSYLEGNGLDAFVTFFHPESKYAGPGTDGILSRDLILTSDLRVIPLDRS
jgi:sugar-specific transcriptional regulator TrmB